MTRDEIAALFAKRQRAWEKLDAAALAKDYAEDASVDSPLAGGSAVTGFLGVGVGGFTSGDVGAGV